MNEEEKVEFNEAVNQVKEGAKDVSETIKNVNIKEDSKATGNFIKDMIMRPLEVIKEVVNAEDGKYLKYAIILLALFCIAGFAENLEFLFSKYYTFGEKMGFLVKGVIEPVLEVVIFTGVLLFMQDKTNKKNLMKVLFPLVVICMIPTIASAYFGLINDIISFTLLNKIISIVTTVLKNLTVILTFFAIKELFPNESGNKVFVKYVIIFGILTTILELLTSLRI